MAYMDKITIPQHGSAALVVRMMRRYTALRERIADREDDLSDLVAFGRTLGFSATAGVAIASLFEITEAVVGQALRTGCCASAALSTDEVAILCLLSTDLPLSGQGSYDVPHGLPGALTWAVISARRLCDGFGVPAEASLAPPAPMACPFQASA